MKNLYSILIVSCISLTLFAQRGDLSSVQIRTTHLAGSVYMLEGSGGNIGVSVGADGVIMVDDQFAPLTSKIVAAIQEISDQPIKFLVNTHLHGDHTGGNENLGKMGALIFAHDLVRDRLVSRTRNRQTGVYGPGAPEGGLPVVTFKNTVTLPINGEEVRVIKMPPAHTDGDSIVNFTGSNVIHMGDVYRTITYPYVDTHRGGSFKGTLAALDAVLELAAEDTILLPGHRAPSNKKEMRAWRNMLKTIGDRVQASIDNGDTLEQTLAKNPSREIKTLWQRPQGMKGTNLASIVSLQPFILLTSQRLSGHLWYSVRQQATSYTSYRISMCRWVLAADPVFSLSSQTMKTSGFQTFHSVSDPVAENTGNNKLN
ncbi:MAG: MBL fold metallo-hydrolase [Verrucomicrobia bacterium]|nr:MBL fold metallo-hydrolase [Verrucomicrobiota bacterium]